LCWIYSPAGQGIERHAKDHHLSLVQRQSRRGDELLLLDLSELESRRREPVRRRRLLGKLVSDKDPKKSNAVMKAVLQMKKLDSKKLQETYDAA
jgi:hypothetical protein